MSAPKFRLRIATADEVLVAAYNEQPMLVAHTLRRTVDPSANYITVRDMESAYLILEQWDGLQWVPVEIQP